MNGSILNGGQHQRRSIRNEELSRLEQEIKKAYVLKALHAQLAEQEADRLAADVQTRIEHEVSRCRSDAEHERRERARELELKKRTEELKETLDRQVEEKREERCLLEEEERRERKILVQLDRVREEKDQMEKLRRREELAEQELLQRLVQQEIQAIEKSKLEEREALEELRNENYARQLEERSDKLKLLRVAAQRRRDEAIEKVAKMLLELQVERSERRRLMSDLMLEEVKIDVELEAREAELRRRQKMRDYAEGLEEQIRFEEECRKRFLEREREFAEAVMAKVMESETMERLTAEVRRRRRLEYRQELERLMREREKERLEVLAKLRVEFEEERKAELAEREEARKARLILLEQHIDNVADFMSRKSLYQEERGVVEDSRKKKK